MHYRNGREAKNGDKIVKLEGGKVVGPIGITSVEYDVSVVATMVQDVLLDKIKGYAFGGFIGRRIGMRELLQTPGITYRRVPYLPPESMNPIPRGAYAVRVPDAATIRFNPHGDYHGAGYPAVTVQPGGDFRLGDLASGTFCAMPGQEIPLMTFLVEVA